MRKFPANFCLLLPAVVLLELAKASLDGSSPPAPTGRSFSHLDFLREIDRRMHANVKNSRDRPEEHENGTLPRVNGEEEWQSKCELLELTFPNESNWKQQNDDGDASMNNRTSKDSDAVEQFFHELGSGRNGTATLLDSEADSVEDGKGGEEDIEIILLEDQQKGNVTNGKKGNFFK